eukprot:s1044_g10.t1
MKQLESALASADGSAQSWNEVYQHPKPCASLKAYKKRFRLTQKIETETLESLESRKDVLESLPHDCGLKPGKLEKYVTACGLDVDIGVGSLVLALNHLEGVTTLSSCNSFHVGAHEEEALVAFTAPKDWAERLQRDLGDHFRRSREDVVQPQKLGMRAQRFASYIVFSDARLKDGRPDALQRMRDMMMLAERVHQLAHSPLDAGKPLQTPPVAATLDDCLAMKVSVGEAELNRLRQQWAQGNPLGRVSAVKAYPADELDDLRDQLVSELKGLQAIETQHTVALVLPFCEISGETISALKVLRATFEGGQWRDLVGKITGCNLRVAPNCALVAVPPGGHVFPQCFGGIGKVGVGFTLFLTESWWTEGDGGILELFEDDARSTKIVPKGGQLYIYQAAACGITRVVSDEAPQLAVHGIFVQADAPSWLPGGSSELFASCQLSTGDFSAEDRELLEAVIAPKYLDLGQMESLCQQFEEESQLRLPGFLRSDCLGKISAALREGDSKDDLGNGWQLLGPVLHRRVCAFGKVWKGKKRLASQCPAGKALAQLAKVLASPAFLRYLGRLTAVKGTSDLAVCIRRFRPGLDYERPTCTAQAQLDVVLAFESLPGTVRARRRRLRTLGGAEVYAERDAGERTAEAAGLLAGANGVPCAPEVLLRLPLANNVLRLVLRDAQTSHGTEPLASRSSSSRWEIRLALPTELEEEDAVQEVSPKRRPEKKHSHLKTTLLSASAMKLERKRRRAKLCSGLLAFACLFLATLPEENFVASIKASGRSDTRRMASAKNVDEAKEVKELPKEKMQNEEEGDPYAFFVPAVVFFLYLGFGTIYSTEYFMPMGDVGGKVAVGFGVLFVLLVVGVALKEVMD